MITESALAKSVRSNSHQIFATARSHPQDFLPSSMSNPSISSPPSNLPPANRPTSHSPLSNPQPSTLPNEMTRIHSSESNLRSTLENEFRELRSKLENCESLQIEDVEEDLRKELEQVKRSKKEEIWKVFFPVPFYVLFLPPLIFSSYSALPFSLLDPLCSFSTLFVKYLLTCYSAQCGNIKTGKGFGRDASENWESSSKVGTSTIHRNTCR